MSAREDEEYEEYDDYWEPSSSSPVQADWRSAQERGEGFQRSLALGLLAMAPLFLAYELGLGADASLTRNAAELVLLRGLAAFDDSLIWLRPLLVLAGMLAALVVCFRRRIALGPSLLRLVIEGVVGAIVIGPALAFSMRIFGDVPPELFRATESASAPELAAAARIFGGAAYEELLFRVLLYGGLFFLTRRVALFFGSGERQSIFCSDVVGVLGSALVFAALHLELFSRWLGVSGELYSGPVFLWRMLAGVLLALLFRWRGPGVAAWTHALFNLALFLGAGVEVLL